MQHQPEVNPERIGLYGTSFGCANVTYTAGVDERAKCTVAVVGPGDCERQFRMGPNFDAFMDKVRRAKAEFVISGKVSYMQTMRLMARDPDVVADLEKSQKLFPTWKPEVSFESLADIMEFKPESVVDRISPRAILWLHTDKDKLVPLLFGQKGGEIDRALEGFAAHELADTEHPIECDLLLCGQDAGAKETVSQLGRSLGLRRGPELAARAAGVALEGTTHNVRDEAGTLAS